MLYSELIAEITDRTEVKNSHAKSVVDAMVSTITECAKRGEDVSVNNLGIFRSKMMPEYEGHNPASGEKVTVPAHRVLRLSVSSVVKKSIN